MLKVNPYSRLLFSQLSLVKKQISTYIYYKVMIFKYLLHFKVYKVIALFCELILLINNNEHMSSKMKISFENPDKGMLDDHHCVEEDYKDEVEKTQGLS